MKVYTEPSDLSQHERMPGDFKLLWPLVKDAFNRNFWLYHKLTGDWFTPEEFRDQYQKKQMNNYEVNVLLQNLIVRDPRDGNIAYHKEIEKEISQHHKKISTLRAKGEAFLNKVIGYYQKGLQG
ncbi:hypothetical protein LPB86_15665 [Pedobacter sp. MC2016-14]|uniref:hypothetical protein n=1 Tax=Pedobacter sp. MC2016-14 TaxID=2897327 RepID=UPI001E3DA101|nr:hypothetical protein [Pedobacter sp. MC2016-14]MCD0489679.1 hypothetical protein [Pedobacter sp. MC2016-14]